MLQNNTIIQIRTINVYSICFLQFYTDFSRMIGRKIQPAHTLEHISVYHLYTVWTESDISYKNIWSQSTDRVSTSPDINIYISKHSIVIQSGFILLLGNVRVFCTNQHRLNIEKKRKSVTVTHLLNTSWYN